jgi:EmrB/QacA subfamily drug resistance transporter
MAEINLNRIQSQGRKQATLIAVCISTFMLPLDYTVVAVALHAIQRELNASFTDLQWVINGYTLTFAAFLLAGGALADLFGRRRIFVVGMVVFMLSSLFCGIAITPLMLNLARGLQGIGAALMFSASLPLLVQEFQGTERTRAFGIFGAVVGIGAASGPFLGGIAISSLGWRWAFLLNVPVTAAVIGLTLLKVGESRDPTARGIDWGGFITFTVSCFLLIFALISGNEMGWNNPLIVMAFISTGLLVALFGFIEMHQSYPMFDLTLFKNPTFIGVSIPPLVLSISFWGIFLYFPLYYQSILNYSALQAGLAALPFAVPLFVMGPVGSMLAARLSSRVLLSVGQLLVGLGDLLLMIASPNSTWLAFAAGALLSGTGAGLINGEMSNVAMSIVPIERSGMASGINSTMRQVGVALGFAGLGAILARQTSNRFFHLIAHTTLAATGRDVELANMVVKGDITGAIVLLPPEVHAAFVDVANASFFNGFQTIILVAATVALIGALATFALVRR